MKRHLEIACFNLPSAMAAIEGGADRIELCSDYSLGGLTPSIDDFVKLKSVCAIPIYVMIRPKGGGFVYTKEELLTMKQQVDEFKDLGADGFVFGILNDDGTIDLSSNSSLVEAAGDIPCTFHRAFDVLGDVGSNLEAVKKCGFAAILTSGKGKAATEGLSQLEWLISHAGEGLTIMPGGGVRSTNLVHLKSFLNTSWFHSSGISQGEIADVEEIRLMKNLLM